MGNGMNAASELPINDLSSNGLLTIDIGALRHNYVTLQSLAPTAEMAAVVKADAYGIGADKAAPALYNAGCRIFFVALFHEALALRNLLPRDALVYVLNGLLPSQEHLCSELEIRPVLNSLAQIRGWNSLGQSLGKKLNAAVQIDSGMSRLGLSSDELESLKSSPDLLKQIEIDFVMSHLACADEPDHPQNARQRDNFDTAVTIFGDVKHCFSNSGGLFLGEAFHKSIIRPGISLYGVSPVRSLQTALKPVVSLNAAVIQTRRVKAGTAIGYGANYVAPANMTLATIAAGYADGLPRSLSNRGAAYFKGTRLPIVGRVSMDSIILDVSALNEDELQLGDMVELIGPNQSLDDLADAAGTIAYEILTSLGNRYKRQYLGTETINLTNERDALPFAASTLSASAFQ